MKIIKVITYNCLLVLCACNTFQKNLDPTSRLVFKEHPINSKQLIYAARWREERKGGLYFVLTQDNGFLITTSDTVRSYKGNSHVYAGFYSLSNDTLHLSFSHNHFLPGLQYAVLKGDTLHLKQLHMSAPLVIPGRHFKTTR